MLAGLSDPSVMEILLRSLDGKMISRTEACDLMLSNNLGAIVKVAGIVRDRSKKNKAITYSRKVFINLVDLCRDACSYCTYKKEPDSASLLKPSQVLAIAEVGKQFKCTEALFVTGERPEQKFEQAKSWLNSVGHTSTVEYLGEMCELVLTKTGLLPHTNAGTLTRRELSFLKFTNVSMGLMLESSSERLMEKGNAHEMAPSKNPKARIKTLESAGNLRIPMTTGILVGIGETQEEIVDSLLTIRDLNKRYGNIQEVIIQNFAPKPETKMASCTAPSHSSFLKSVAIARILMPDMNIQVPPNLSPDVFGSYVDAGINDWGGISPVTIDHVNPEFPWPTIETVNSVTLSKGFKLCARLPVYPEYLNFDGFIPDGLRPYINQLCNRSGLVKGEYLA